MNYVIDAAERPAAPVKGGGLFPVRRIFCIGRNYADHVREMGGDPKAQPPVFFTKPADAIVPDDAVIPYAQSTDDLHFEGELVVALKAGGKAIKPEESGAKIYGYAAGCDLTRRDHQRRAKDAGAPWDTAKGFDQSAPLGAIVPVEQVGDLSGARLKTFINEEKRQDAPLSQMIWSVEDIIAALSKQFELHAGDLIFTGTPEGVGAVKPGDHIAVQAGPLSLNFRIAS